VKREVKFIMEETNIIKKKTREEEEDERKKKKDLPVFFLFIYLYESKRIYNKGQTCFFNTKNKTPH
jgi:hypothetical protein